MATKILIDGYNFLWQERIFRDEAIRGHDKGREAVLTWLSKYPQLQAFEVFVVFDAYKAGSFRASGHVDRGLNVVFTAEGESADDWIRARASELGPSAIVVSSDQEVARHAERKGCGVLGSREFQTVLEHPENYEADPSRRLTKAKRRALSRLLRSFDENE